MSNEEACHDEWVTVCMSDVSVVSVLLKDVILGEAGTERVCEWVTTLYWHIVPRMPHKRHNRWRGPLGPAFALLTVHTVHAGRRRRDGGTHLLCFKRCLGRKCACILLFAFLYKLNCFFRPRHYIFPSDVCVFCFKPLLVIPPSSSFPFPLPQPLIYIHSLITHTRSNSVTHTS